MKWFGHWCAECRRMHFTWPGSIVLAVVVWCALYAAASMLR